MLYSEHTAVDEPCPNRLERRLDSGSFRASHSSEGLRQREERVGRLIHSNSCQREIQHRQLALI